MPTTVRTAARESMRRPALAGRHQPDAAGRRGRRAALAVRRARRRAGVARRRGAAARSRRRARPLPVNPFAASADANRRRVVAYGLRNPFRFTFRPGTSEVWIGDVGLEHLGGDQPRSRTRPRAIDELRLAVLRGRGAQRRVRQRQPQPVRDPLRAGTARHRALLHVQPQREGRDRRELPDRQLRDHRARLLYGRAAYPTAYEDALFFADYSRNCIWVMRRGANGLPNPSTIETFVSGAGNPVDLEIGPDGDLYYADLDGGRIHRIRYTSANSAPTARASATRRPARCRSRCRLTARPRAILIRATRCPMPGTSTPTARSTTRRRPPHRSHIPRPAPTTCGCG